jgi:hypothetical protein
MTRPAVRQRSVAVLQVMNDPREMDKLVRGILRTLGLRKDRQ